MKWVDDPCSGQPSRRPGDEDGVKVLGEASALCPEENRATQGPRGKYYRSGEEGKVGHLRPMADTLEGNRDLVTTDVTCRERPTCSS